MSGIKPSAFAGKIKSLSQFQATAPQEGERIEKIATDLIDCEKQIRTEANPGFAEDKLRELGHSIQHNGQQQACVVRPNPNKPGRYLMVAGERRLRSCVLVGVPTVDCVVRTLTDEQARRIQRAENTHREALSQLEEAAAVAEDYKRMGSLKAVAEEWDRSLAWVSECLRFLEAMQSEEVRQAVAEGLTADKTVVNDLHRLAKSDKGAAQAAVEVMRENPDGNNRKIVGEAKKQAKAAQGATQQELGASADPAPARGAAPAKPKAPPKPKEQTVMDLLMGVYVRQVDEQTEAAKIIEGMPEPELMKCSKVLSGLHRQGRSTTKRDFPGVLVRALNNGEFASDGPELYKLVAFIDGATTKEVYTFQRVLQLVEDMR